MQKEKFKPKIGIRPNMVLEMREFSHLVRAFYGLEENQIGVFFSHHVLCSPCSSKKEGRRKGLSFNKSRYGNYMCMETSMEILCVWNLYVWKFLI